VKKIISSRILEFMRDEAYRPLSFKELVRSLGVEKSGRDALKRTLAELVSAGSLIRIRGGRYGLPSKMNLVTGRLACHPNGFGFVIDDRGGPDVFIAPRRMGGAMHADAVVARVEGGAERRGGERGQGEKREGRIIRVTERANRVVVGVFARDRGYALVVPTDARLLDNILIPPGGEAEAWEGAVVSAEITAWPGARSAPLGRVVEVLGDPEDPDVEAGVILRKYALPVEFPARVLREARGVPDEVPEAALKGRRDLRDTLAFTIDGESAKDFDDAVSIEKRPDGFLLRVSIADVSYYVEEGSELDAEARERSTSVYFPDRCIPMLPEALSNGICSLKPGVDRLTLTVELDFDTRGRVRKKRFYESVIRSSMRLTYTRVKRLLDRADAELERERPGVAEALRVMEVLARLLGRRRSEKGSIDFDLPEPQILIDIEGKIEDIVRSERNIAHRIIEEFMLAANRAVAEEFSAPGLPFIYRVHPEPDQESIEEFGEFIAAFGLSLKPGGGPRAFARVLKAVEGRPEERLVNHVLLRSMKQAVYSAENIGHFGLAFDDYTHFTSPIRRYPDLIVHRLLKRLIHRRYGRREQEAAEAALGAIAAHSSARERKAMEAERDMVDLKKARFMRDHVGEVFEGLISGVTSFGLFVELSEYFVEALVHVSSLMDDYYVYDEKMHAMTGENTKRRFRLGDPVTVLIERVDMERRRIEAVFSGDSVAGRPSGPRSGARGKAGKGAGEGRSARPARPVRSRAKKGVGPGRAGSKGRVAGKKAGKKKTKKRG